MLKEGANEEAENLTGQRTVGRGTIQEDIGLHGAYVCFDQLIISTKPSAFLLIGNNTKYVFV